MFRYNKVFYGWVIVFACALITGAGMGIYNSAVNVLIKPICESLGFARGEFTLFNTISMLTGVLVLPAFGSVLRKYKTRHILLVCAVAGGLVRFGYAASTRLWHFYLLGFLNGLFINGTNFVIVGNIIRVWFKDNRGVATGIAYAGSGLLGSLTLPAISGVYEQYGWQWAFRLMGIMGMAVLIPVILLLIKDRPEDMGLKPYTKTTAPDEKGAEPPDAQPIGLTRGQALKTPTFWLLAVSVFLIAFCSAGPQQHTASYLTDIGYSPAFATSIISFYLIVLTVGKISLGALFDKFGVFMGSLFVGACCIVSPTLALAAGIPAMPWVYTVVLGLANSGISVPNSVLTSTYFGDREFSSIFSMVTMASTLGTAVSAPLMGAIYDFTGHYNPGWYLAIAAGCVVTACLVGVNITGKKLSATFEDMHM